MHGFGTNVETPIRTAARRLMALPASSVRMHRSAMASTSSSRSVGRPIMKYVFTCVQPRRNASAAMPSSSSSGMNLLMTARRRGVAASGAKVSPLRRTPDTMSAISTANESSRNDGNATDTFSLCARSAACFTSVRGREKSHVESDTSVTCSRPVFASVSSMSRSTSGSVRSRTGRVTMPAWQKRQPCVQPRKISRPTPSCTSEA